MKKLFSLFVPLMALFLTLAPQQAMAQIDEYLCVVGSATINVRVTGTVSEFPDLWYSTDKTNWTQITVATNWNTDNVTTYFKGHNPGGFNHSSTNFVSIGITGGNPSLAGNVMSLIDDVNFATNNSTIPCDYCFYALFSPYPPSSFGTTPAYHTTSTSSSLYHAKDMVLPATILKDYCYAYMFAQNSGLYDSPVLPAIVMKPWCYAHMFEYCMNNFCSQTAYNSGTRLPTLPSQQLAEGCYAYMFNMCTSIYNKETDWYCLPAEELAPHCYEGMFGTYYGGQYNKFHSLEIMATSLQDRSGNDITNCMRWMLNYNTWNQTAGQYGRGDLRLRMYWLDWGNTSSDDAPTKGWYTGYTYSSSYFYYQKGLTPATGESQGGSSSATVATRFPYSFWPYETEYTYLTFDCKTNGGVWESGSNYDTDIRRVVRADYTAKTIPAPPVYKEGGKRFIGWFDKSTNDGVMITESQLKKITTATTVYAHFVDDDEYTLTILSNEHASTVSASDGTNNYSAGTHILNSNDQTFTCSYSGIEAGFSFYKWTGGSFTGNDVTFGTSKDLVISAVFIGTSVSTAKESTVYLVGTGAGTSRKFDLPSQAVDLGDAGIWAKYNVDKNNSSNGYFASSETATGSYFAWGMLGQGASTSGNYYSGASTMTDGSTLPVTDETDAAYYYCGHNWRIPTKDEWQTLINNTTITTSSYNKIFTSNTNGNKMTLPKNGYTTSTTGGASMSNTINYWTSTFYNWNNSNSIVYGYRGGMYSSTVYDPVLGYQDAGNNNNWLYYGCGIRPILDFPAKNLTIKSGDYTYVYKCELYQQMSITAEGDEDEGYVFARWKDEAGNVISTSKTLVVVVYDDLTYTAEFEEMTGEKHLVTFYNEDGSSVLFSEPRTEGLMPVYRGETPTKAGYTFIGWTPALTPIGDADVYYYATFLPNYTITTDNGGKATISLTADGYDATTVSGTYMVNTEVTLEVTNVASGYRFSQWSDGNTQNPRTITVEDNISYTALFGTESPDADVDVYENVSADKTEILYLLKDTTVRVQSGWNNYYDITYHPVDLGYGVAWADKNVGATSEGATGSLFRWGDPTAKNSFSKNASIVSSLNPNNEDICPPNYDMARRNMGTNWRLPSKQEFEDLIAYTDKSDNNKFSNKSDGLKFIIIPGKGYKGTQSTYESQKQHYWSNKLTKDGTTTAVYILTGTGSNNTFNVSNKTSDDYTAEPYYGMPVRAIYESGYTVRTLTIKVGDKNYVYKCQDGQKVTVTANATTEGYVFDKWLLADGETPDDVDGTLGERTFVMTSDITRTATFHAASVVSNYTVNFAADNTGYGSVDVAAINDVPAGSQIIVSGSTVTINGTPVTASITATDDEQYTYHFDGWTIGGAAIANDAIVDEDNITITANFSCTTNTYTVTWKNGEVTLETDENVAYGATPEYNGATNPTKANDLVYSYTFAGWNDGTTTYGLSDDLPEVSGNVTYTAVYNSADLATFDLVDDIDAGGLYNGHDYYAAIATLATLKDQTRNVTYHRTMEAGKWHVVSLPFNFNLILNSSHPFANNIYELTDVTYSDGGYLNFEFTSMTTMMMANKPYVFYSTTEAKDVTFNGVTFAKLERYTGDGASIGITGGSVDFINTTSRIQLTNGDKRQIYIYNNKLYYPGSDAAYMRAFRGYFYLNDITIHHVTPRMRIVLDGQTATELEMTESAGTADEVRKYMENGVMVIERNGVKYNAQGGRME